MRNVTIPEYNAMEPRREASQLAWPNAADVGAAFAAAGIDSAMGAGGPGVDGGSMWGPWGTDGGALFQGAASDWGNLGSAAFGDYMALYPGARFDHGMLEIPIGPDSVTPAYLTLDGTGAVGADFTGHVRASGLDITASSTTDGN